MLNRLADFIYRDYRARWQAFNWTVATVCLYGFVCNGILSRPLKAVSREALALTTLSMLGGIWRYVRMPAPESTDDAILRSRNAFRYGLALAGFVALAVLGQPVTTLEAAVVDSRLRRLLTEQLDAPRLDDAQRLVARARDEGVHASPTVIKKIGDRLLNVLGSVPNVPMTGTNNQSTRALKLCSSAAQLAKALELDVPPNLVSAGGLGALNIAESGHGLAPVAWQTTVAYAALSTLNAPRMPDTQNRKIGPFNFAIHFIHEPDVPVGSMFSGLAWTYGDDVPIAQAARFEAIGFTENGEYKSGPRTIVVNPVQYGIVIDEMWIRNATVQNTVVAYSGGPIRLENVRFANCDFSMPDVSTARELARLVLTAAPISFQAETGNR